MFRYGLDRATYLREVAPALVAARLPARCAGIILPVQVRETIRAVETRLATCR